jgi:hypothetical protein
MKFLLSSLLLCMLPFISQSQVSKSLHQILTVEEDNPQTMVLKLEANDIKLLKTKGTRILVVGVAEISDNNMRLLDFLITQGRYRLELSNSGNGRVTVESLPRKELKIKEKTYGEALSYKIFIPEEIGTIILNDKVVTLED